MSMCSNSGMDIIQIGLCQYCWYLLTVKTVLRWIANVPGLERIGKVINWYTIYNNHIPFFCFNSPSTEERLVVAVVYRSIICHFSFLPICHFLHTREHIQDPIQEGAPSYIHALPDDTPPRSDVSFHRYDIFIPARRAFPAGQSVP